MATSVTFNGSSYSIPALGERQYGQNVSNFLIAVAGNALSKAGGSFVLTTADVNFGASYGLVALYLKSASSNIAASGVVRFSNNEGIGWRNAANSADLILKVNASNQLEYNGVPVITGSSGVTPITAGGTGQTSANAALNALLPTQTNNRLLKSDGTNTSFAQANLTTDVTGTLPIANGGTGQTSATAAFNALDPLTTKGDIIAHNGTDSVRLAVGTVDGQVLKADSTTATGLAWGDAGGGSGEINAILNPSAASATTGWTAGTSHSIARDTSNSPLSPVIASSLAISSSAAVALGSQTSTSGDYYSFTMPTGLRNRKLKVEFSYTTPASSTGTWAVSVYNSTTRATLTTDSSGDTILPSGVTGGKFVAYFDTDSGSTYSVNLVQRTRSSSNTLYITNVIVGPGIQPQGYAGQGPFVYTPTLTNFGNGTAAVAWTRQGSRMLIEGALIVGSTLPGASLISFSLPSGYTADYTSIPKGVVNTDAYQRVGTATAYKSGAHEGAIIRDNTSSTNFVIYGDDGLTGWNNTTPVTWAAGDTITLSMSVPIAEWAGSGTVQLAQNDVEYASNTSTSDADDTSSFAYGPGGSSTPGALTATRTKRVRFQTPIQPGDSLVLEFMNSTVDTNLWLPADGNYWGTLSYQQQLTTAYGVYIRKINATDIDIFFSASAQTSSGVYGAAGTSWSSITNTKWRVRKSSAGAAVGFGIVVPGTSSGLVSASGLPGNTTGNAIASGYVGEKISTTVSNSSALTSGTAINAATLTLNKGIYIAYAKAYVEVTSVITSYTNKRVSISTTSATHDVATATFSLGTSGSQDDALSPGIKYLNIAADGTSIYLVCSASFTAGGGSVRINGSNSLFEAIRIA